jgi:hypothetical protein
MTRTLLRPRLSRLAGIALLCCAGAAQAQFVWIAPNGTRQYSDQPPPPGTPASKILKAPGRPAMHAAEPAEAAAPAAAKPATLMLAERELDFRKRAKERDEAERKAGMEAQGARAKRDYCNELRKSKRAYDSGIRIREVGSDGQQRVLTDSERTQRTASVDKALADCR